MKVINVSDSLVLWLDRPRKYEFFTAEQAAKDLNCSKADITRAIAVLKIRGWSIYTSNPTAYRRAIKAYARSKTDLNPYPVVTGRKKGEKREIDYAEPDWEPTRYIYKKPKQ